MRAKLSLVQLVMRIVTESTWRQLAVLKSFAKTKRNGVSTQRDLSISLLANGITSNDKKRSVFLTVIGARAYKQLRSLITPEKPGETDFATLSEAMKNHYAPTPSEIVQRFRFNSRFRRPGESVSMFVAELRAVAEFCNFGDTLNLMIRDRLVCGINDENTQRLLLAEKELTYDKALEIARSQEAATQNVLTLRGMRSRVGSSTTPGPDLLWSQLMLLSLVNIQQGSPHLVIKGTVRILLNPVTDVATVVTNLLNVNS